MNFSGVALLYSIPLISKNFLMISINFFDSIYKKYKPYIISAICLFIVYMIYFTIESDRILKNSHTYTLGIVDEIKATGNGLRVYISIVYENKRKTFDYIEDIGRAKKLYIGRRLFIKIVPDNINRIMDLILTVWFLIVLNSLLKMVGMNNG